MKNNAKNNAKRVIAIAVITIMLLSVVGCSKKTEGGAASTGNNAAPVISGVADSMVMVGNEINILDGVKATDAEDGDLTSKISVEAMPSLDIKNGKAVPELAGSYELTFSVTDSKGASVQEYATLIVTKATAEKTLYKQFDFTSASKAEANGWKANISESASGSAELKNGAFVFDISNPGNGDGDVQLALNGMELEKADYIVKIWAKSTADTYCHLLAVDENAGEWRTFGGAYNVVIGNAIKPLELYFSAEDNDKASILVNLGKITPNPDNLADTTPNDFSVTVDKIEVYEISGNETKEAAFTCAFDNSEQAVSVEYGDGAAAAVEIADSAKLVIDSYPTEGGVWSIKANLLLDGVTVEEGKKYYYSFKVKADNNQSGECLVESLTKYDSERANFAGFAVTGGEETVINGVFTAEKNVSDPVIRLQIGNPSEGVTANAMVIDDIEFGLLTGDKETKKTITSFSDKVDMFATFNGTDEDNDLGVGTIYADGKNLVYRIDQGGITDWHNKLICGTGENPLVLESDSYYEINITCKADKDVHCSFFLNTLGGWDPRIAEGMDITTTEQTFTFKTTDTFILDMNFEMLFQFGSEATANLGEVSVEFSDISIYQEKVNN